MSRTSPRAPGAQTPQRVRGTQDIVGDEQRRFAHVLATFERVRRLYCFQRVDVPVFEATEVFARSIGEIGSLLIIALTRWRSILRPSG